MTKTKTKAPKRQMSIGELKTWLDGYCSAQGNDWSPTPQQWKLIKNKILSVVEDTLSAQPIQNYTHAPVQYTGRHSVVTPQEFSNNGGRPLEHTVVGVTGSPAVIMNGDNMKLPDKGTPGGPSDFA